MDVLVFHLANWKLKTECNFDIIIFDISPDVFESFVAKSLLQRLSKRILGIVVDESHCVAKWLSGYLYSPLNWPDVIRLWAVSYWSHGSIISPLFCFLFAYFYLSTRCAWLWGKKDDCSQSTKSICKYNTQYLTGLVTYTSIVLIQKGCPYTWIGQHSIVTAY